ncbi:hypothetical protein VTN00DRAFT_6642 [Thermoascus crustaceus]|uniref:uncharacterized protein n=1 Tax=Thermoascus crustaceus TaxID=5088 RepID=UPI0037435598
MVRNPNTITAAFTDNPQSITTSNNSSGSDSNKAKTNPPSTSTSLKNIRHEPDPSPSARPLPLEEKENLESETSYSFSSTWSSWTDAERGGVIAASILAFMFLLVVSYWVYLKAKRRDRYERRLPAGAVTLFRPAGIVAYLSLELPAPSFCMTNAEFPLILIK